MTLKPSRSAPPAGSELRQAFDAAATYAAGIARLPPADVQAVAAQEAAGSAIPVDEAGVTQGAHDALVVPARERLARWRALQADFLARLEPRRADIDAVQGLPQAVEELRAKRAGEIAALRERWAEQPLHALIAQQWQTGQTVYAQESLRHGQRLALMAATSPFYWMGLLLIGVAEWLINYDTFLIFTGVVAIAAGATVILAVLLAFAAHGHGELLKQWSYRFGRFQARQSRVGSWRMLVLASVAVLVVLAAAGGSRYAAVMRSLSQTRQPDLIGGGYQLDINPMRDVLLSLLANIAAWIVGIFISYFCHDVDPEFMAATHQHRVTGRAYFRARRPLEEETQVIQARTNRDEAALENSAFSRRAGSETERGMLTQMGQHDLALREALLTHLRAELQRYRTELVRQLRLLAVPPPIVATTQDGRPDALGVEQFAALPVGDAAGLLEPAR